MLIVESLTVGIGNTLLLDSIDLTVHPGELLAIMGENGSGKSTLMSYLAGHVAGRGRQQQGRVCLDGVPLQYLSATDLARRRAWMRQSSPPVFSFTSRELVALGRYASPPRVMSRHARHDVTSTLTLTDGADIALAALELVGATLLADRDVATLSGGELARVQFARVLAQLWPDSEASVGAEHRTRFLLLDEPTAAMDLKHQQRLLSLAQQLTRRWRLGVVAIVHDPNLALRYADRIALLQKGRLMAARRIANIDSALFEHCLGLPLDVYTNAAGDRMVAPA